MFRSVFAEIEIYIILKVSRHKMLKLKELTITGNKENLSQVPQGKVLINTINAHSYNTALKDSLFAEALQKGDILIPDGASIVMACR